MLARNTHNGFRRKISTQTLESHFNFLGVFLFTSPPVPNLSQDNLIRRVQGVIS